MHTISALIIFVMGIHMFSNGLVLSGISLMQKTDKNMEMAVVENGIQYIRTEIGDGYYPAITVRKGIPVEWTIIVPYSCWMGMIKSSIDVVN